MKNKELCGYVLVVEEYDFGVYFDGIHRLYNVTVIVIVGMKYDVFMVFISS